MICGILKTSWNHIADYQARSHFVDMLLATHNIAFTIKMSVGFRLWDETNEFIMPLNQPKPFNACLKNVTLT
jgi:hypothetical protein